MGRSVWPELRRALEAGGLAARVLGVALRGELWVLELAVAERGLPGVACVPLAFEDCEEPRRLHERWAGREVRLAVDRVCGRVAFLREDDELGSDPDLVALRRRTGIELWRQDAFKRRGLSAPASIGPHVVVADFEGFIHWLDKADGSQVARISAGARVSNAPVVVGDVLVVLDDKGRISAFRAKAPPAAPAETAPAAGSGS